ncbi:hypothetical protein L0666_11995 [Octadecabacter sp. CECT 8868]|uniref:hypothetical protein n=1 Tax=Octadecabacter algicola TaxID=2909342 RepID=UPI001F1709D2|nr:hypothetical protein [Octadecabacter algicola]MCF2905711.1 hypothetical protein [Octadecabacter algicola]
MHTLPQTISFHIGAHKTASSHLQNVLYKNRGLLADEGIRLFGPRYLRMRGRNLAAMFDTSWSESPTPRRTPKQQLQFLTKTRKHLLLSEENFVGNLADSRGRVVRPLYPAAAQRLTEVVEKWSPIPVDLFLAVRDPAAYLASAYSQAMFGGVHVRPRQYRLRNDWREIDWAEYVERLRSVTRVGQIYIWRQEDYEQVLPQVLCRMLRWDDSSRIEPIHNRVHQGLSVTAVQKTIEAASEGQVGNLARDARRAYPVGDHHKQFQLYNASILRRAAEVYATQMARIEQLDGVTVLHPPADPLKG